MSSLPPSLPSSLRYDATSPPISHAEFGLRIVESARGLAHSKTLRARRTVPGFPPGLGLRRPPAAFPSAIGAAYSDDVAPERSFEMFAMCFYKDASPTGLRRQ